MAASARDVAVAAALLAAAPCAGGCPRSTDSEVQAAFEAAQRGRSSQTRKRERDRGRAGNDAPDDSAPTDPWAPVQDKLAQSIAVFADVVDASTFEALAKRWCEVRPEPEETEEGATYQCFPDPPLRVAGRAFTLELSASGVIGLLTDEELTGAESRKFAEEARAAAARFCAVPWKAIAAENPGPRAQQFHTCPSDGGVTLAVGRFPVGEAGDRWRVSLSVLGST